MSKRRILLLACANGLTALGFALGVVATVVHQIKAYDRQGQTQQERWAPGPGSKPITTEALADGVRAICSTTLNP